jgi:alcohol dehydrogenase YqhD (iron-dependent ADH family)
MDNFVFRNPTKIFFGRGMEAQVNLLDTGRVGDWASHDIEHELSGIYDVAHGAGLAVVFPAWMKHALSQDVARFAQLAARVWNVKLDQAGVRKVLELAV